MSRWLRLYDDTINDPKVIKLSEALRWHWIALLCVASKSGGLLPPLEDVAIQLRVTSAKATEIIAKLAKAGLLDKTETGFIPHNWEGRQFRSDTSNDRVKRYRQRKCNVTQDVTVTPPDTETEEDTDSVANATGADAPPDPRKRLFDEGLPALARLTGKGPDACRSFVGKCLKAADDDAITVLGLIEEAERNRVIDPSAWIAARLKSTGPPTSARPLTESQRRQQETNDVRAKLRAFANGGTGGGTPDRVLPLDQREQSGGVCGGSDAGVLSPPGAPGGGGH